MGAGAVSGHQVSPEDSQLFSPSSTLHTTTTTTTTTNVSSVNGSDSVIGGSGFGGRPPAERSAACVTPRTGRTSVNNMPNKVVSCETCDNSFSFFKRKKICKDCHRSFCSTCLPKPSGSLRQNGRQCDKCTILTSGKFTRQQLSAWRVKDMRCFLDVRNIPTATCKEKHDLIDLLLLHFCLESNSVLREQREHDRVVGELADRMRSSSFYSPGTTLPHQVPQEEFSTTTTTTSRAAEEEEEEEEASRQQHQLHTSSTTTTTAGPSSFSSRTGQNTETRNGEGESSPGLSRIGGDNSQTDDIEGSTGVFMTNELRERQQREMRETEDRLQEELDQDEPETRPGIQRASIEDLESAEEAEKMTVRQLKEILANNFVDYRGCCEKHELVDRVRRLWNETQANKQRASAADNITAVPATSAEPGTGTTTMTTTMTTTTLPGLTGKDPEQDMCKICMDAAIDCILLECGHMITCSKCGKRLADCPICRQYITRVVHVFRS